MNPNILDRFIAAVAAKKLNVYGVVVYKKNETPVSYRWRADTTECLYSGSKAYAALAVGICRDEGRLAFTDRAADFFPEFEASDGMRKVTVRDLLRMASGLETDFFPNIKANMDKDYAAEILKLTPEGKTGESFFYSGLNTYMLSRIVEKVSGSGLRDYLVPRVFDVMEIYNPQWHMCPQGHTLGFSGLYLKTAEYARLGMMYLHGGEYNGTRIVSERFVEETHTDVIRSDNRRAGDSEHASGYGYQVWMCGRPGTWRASGMYGQSVIIAPDRDAMVTFTGHAESNANEVIYTVNDKILAQL